MLCRVWPQLDNFQWVYLQKARKELAVCNMELDVTNYLSSSPPTALVDLKDKIGSFDDASKYDRVNIRTFEY